MREIDELLRRRPRLGTLVGEAQALRAQLAKRRGADALGASSLTAAELRLLPLLSTHLSFAETGRRTVPLAAHRQDAGRLDLPQARGFLPRPGGHPGP